MKRGIEIGEQLGKSEEEVAVVGFPLQGTKISHQEASNPIIVLPQRISVDN
jgi:hypothetical protein